MRGFTIFETLVSILIFSIITMALGFTVVVGKNSFFTTDAATQLRQNVLFAIISMNRELCQTAPSKTNLGAETCSNSITFQIPNDNNADGVAVDASGQIEWGTNIIYARNGLNELTRTQGGVTSVIAPNITGLTFCRPIGESNILQIDITANKTDNTEILEDSEQAIIKMRN